MTRTRLERSGRGVSTLDLPQGGLTPRVGLGSDGLPRCLDVRGDRVDELLLALEGALVAQTIPQLDDEAPAVEVSLEIEQERLHAALVAAVVRVGADRDRRPRAERGPGVDPEGGDGGLG